MPFTLRYIKRHALQTALFLLMTLLSVIAIMTTALSVSDFLRLLFHDDNGQAAVLSLSASKGNLLTAGLDQLYLWLISFGRMKAVLYFSFIIFSVYLLKNIFAYAAAAQIASVRAKIVKDIRNDLFAKAMRLPLAFYGHHRKGDILAHFSSDITEYDENTIGSLQMLISASFSSLLYLAMLLYISPILTLIVLAMLPLMLFIISPIRHKLKRNSAQVQKQNAYILSLIEETIMGLKVIKAYTAIDFSNQRFRASSAHLTRLRNAVYRRVHLASPLSEFLSSIIVIAILIFGCHLIFTSTGSLTPELFISYIMIFVLIIEPLKNISTALSQIKKGRPCADRLQQFLDQDEGSVTNPPHPIPFHGLKKQIEYHHVSFCYQPGRPVLQDISFTLPRGKTIALVGASGSGKSTLADLLPRFADVTQGQILIDGQNLKNYDISSLRAKIGIVSQETTLFNDTVRANIAFSLPSATNNQIQAAAQNANAHHFILNMEQAYDTNIGDQGSRLSGGQRQRLAIARAVLPEPDILILDEATSALDTETERQVQQALDHLLQGRTALIIAHRLSTIINADLILVLKDGKIIERGTHNSLLALGGHYAQLVKIQQLDHHKQNPTTNNPSSQLR